MENKPFGLSYARLQQRMFPFSSPQLAVIWMCGHPLLVHVLVCAWEQELGEIQAKMGFLHSPVPLFFILCNAGEDVKPTGSCTSLQGCRSQLRPCVPCWGCWMMLGLHPELFLLE